MDRPKKLLQALPLLLGVLAACGGSKFTAAPGDGGADDCTPMGPEDCTNNIDDDCDGKTDCADPACTQGFTCVPLPSDPAWSVSSFEPGAQSACPNGYGNPVNVMQAGGNPTCTCACTAAPGSCTGSDVSLNLGPTCATGDGVPATGCQPADPATATTSYISFFPAPATPPTCSPSMVMHFVNPEVPGELCGLTGPAGGGCPSGGKCVPTPQGRKACIARAAAVACPAGFPNSYSVAGSFNDTRACAPCTCAPNPFTCTSPTLTVYSDSACSTELIALTPASGCTGLPPATFIKSLKYAVQPQGGGCMPTGGAAMGSEMPTGGQTVCCL